MEDISNLNQHKCRQGCGVCCITPSISSVIPGMPDGKPANVKCINLSDDLLCKIFDNPNRPDVCKNFNFEAIICGKNKNEAEQIMKSLE